MPLSPLHKRMLGALARRLGVVAAYTVLAVALFSHVVLTGEASFLGFWDASMQTFAWLTKNFAAVQSGTIALWDFAITSGTSHIGEMQPAPFYPLTLAAAPFAPLGSILFIEWFILAHFVIGAVGMHWFLRRAGLGHIPAFLGGIVFSFVGYTAVRAEHQPNLHAGMVWLPWALAACLTALRATSRNRALRWILASGLFMGTTVLAGHMHATIHGAAAFALLCAVWTGRFKEATPARAAVVLLGGAVTGGLFALVQIAPTMEYLDLAYKWYGTGFTESPHVIPLQEFLASTLTWGDWATLFSPTSNIAAQDGGSMYITVTALLLCIAGVAGRTRLALFACVVMALGLAVAMAGDTWLGELFYAVPGLNLVRQPSRALFLFDMGGAMLAAAGLAQCMRWIGRPPSKYSIAGLDQENVQLADEKNPMRLRLAVAAGAAACLLAAGEASLFTARVGPPIEATPLHPANAYYGPMADELERRFLETGAIHRFTPFESDALSKNLGDVREVRSAAGYRSSMLAGYAQWLWQDATPHADNVYFDEIGVRWVVAPATQAETLAGLTETARFGDLILYERPDALPIFWLLDKDETSRPAPVADVTWEQNRVRLRLDGDTAGSMLVFAQPQYPGWEVLVDGQAAELMNYHIFNAIYLERDAQTVEFAYRPWYIWALAGLSLTLLLVTVRLFLTGRREEA